MEGNKYQSRYDDKSTVRMLEKVLKKIFSTFLLKVTNSAQKYTDIQCVYVYMYACVYSLNENFPFRLIMLPLKSSLFN